MGTKVMLANVQCALTTALAVVSVSPPSNLLPKLPRHTPPLGMLSSNKVVSVTLGLADPTAPFVNAPRTMTLWEGTVATRAVIAPDAESATTRRVSAPASPDIMGPSARCKPFSTKCPVFGRSHRLLLDVCSRRNYTAHCDSCVFFCAHLADDHLHQTA